MSSYEIDKIDLTKIAALQQKRTLAFVNHFVISTVQFMNSFAKRCEQKLMQFERKLENINASMVLLEARLSSIPEVNSIQNTTKELVNNDKVDNKEESVSKKNAVAESSDKTETTSETSNHKPEYDRFLKMIQVGVPLDAVKLKISLEGLDPNVFDKILQK